MRNLNPGMRLRSDDQLGPRTEVQVKKDTTSSLEKPKSYFVELKTFKKDFPDRPLSEQEIVWEEVDGHWVQGASWFAMASVVISSNHLEKQCNQNISVLWLSFQTFTGTNAIQ